MRCIKLSSVVHAVAEACVHGKGGSEVPCVVAASTSRTSSSMTGCQQKKQRQMLHCRTLVVDPTSTNSVKEVDPRMFQTTFGFLQFPVGLLWLHGLQTHDGDRPTRCVGQDIAQLSRVRGGFQSTSLAFLRVRGRTKQGTRSARKFRTRSAQTARILELQIEVDKLEFLAAFTKRKRTTPTDDV